MPGRPVVYDPAMDLTIERMTGKALDPSMSIDGTPPRRGQFLNSRQREEIEKLAKRLGLTPSPKWSDYKLWGHIYEKTKGGVQRPSDRILDDPFALFVRGLCDDGHAPYETILVAEAPGGVAMDEGEAKRQQAILKAQAPPCEATMPTGRMCGKPFGQWSSTMTRRSVFEENDREIQRMRREQKR